MVIETKVESLSSFSSLVSVASIEFIVTDFGVKFCGQIDIINENLSYNIITDINISGINKSYYNHLLTINGKDTNQADNVSFRLKSSDTILINSEYLDNITLYPRLQISSGNTSNIVPSSDINKVVLSYSYYDWL